LLNTASPTRVFPMESMRKFFVLLLAIAALFFSAGCGDFLQLYDRDSITRHGEEDLDKIYHIHSKWEILGNSLWVYVPVEGLMSVYKNAKGKSKNKEDKKDVYSYINDVISTIRRVLMNSDVNGIEFYAAMFADTHSGLALTIIGAVEDVKAVNFDRISIDEFRKRFLHETSILPQAIGDEKGDNFKPFRISKAAFIAELIAQGVKADLVSFYGFSMGFAVDWEIRPRDGEKPALAFLIIPDNSKVRTILKKHIRHIIRAYKYMGFSSFIIDGSKKTEVVPLIDVLSEEYIKKKLQDM